MKKLQMVSFDGIAMGSPLGPVLADAFMVELENKIVPVFTGKFEFLETMS